MFDALPLDVLPGIFKESSEYSSQGRYVDGDNVRFWKGFPERIGGNTEISNARAHKPPRGMIAWRSLSNSLLTALGHSRGVQLIDGGSFKDISPVGTDGYPILTLTVSSVSGGPFTTGEVVTDGTTGITGKITAAVSADGPMYVTANDGATVETLATYTVTLTGSPTGSFVTGESITFGGGGTARFIELDGTTMHLYDVVETHTVTIAGTPTGTYQSGEVINFAGGGSATLVSISSLTMTVTRVEGTLSGTITGATSGATSTYSSDTSTLEGTVTGDVSAATGTYSAHQELWIGQITGGSSSATADVDSYAAYGTDDGGATTPFGGGTFGGSVFGGDESLYSTVSDPTTWTFATWGEDLIACPRDGEIYTLDVSAYESNNDTNLTKISNAPSALGIFMNADNRTLVAYGAEDETNTADPLNVRWCDEEDYTTWDATAANTAGALRCESGSVIIGRMPARGGHLISTDTAIYLFRYIGLPFVFSLEKISDQTSLISPHGSAEQDGITYWMGQDGFYYYDGSVGRLPCDVQQYVFGRINVVQAHKVNCATMRSYNEVWWYYVSEDSPDEEIDSYVCYNTVEQTWHIGSKSRTSMIDSSVVLAYPTGCEADGTINAEELGTDDNGTAIAYTLETSEIEVGSGTRHLQSRKLIPDYNRITGTHTVSIKTRGYPQRTERTKGPYNVSGTTEKISVRSRGAMMRFAFAGSDDFRGGRWRYSITGHGDRGN